MPRLQPVWGMALKNLSIQEETHYEKVSGRVQSFCLERQHDGHGHRCSHRRRILHAGHFFDGQHHQPIIGILFQTDFSDVVLHLPFDINLGIGAFISAVINFIILAFVLFCMLKAMNKLMDLGKHEEEKPAEPEAPKAPTQEELLTEILAVLKEQQAANGK